MNDMSVLSLVILFLVPPVAVGAAMLVALKNFKRTGSGSRALKAHFASLAGLFTLLLCSVMGASAETAETAVQASSGSSAGLGYLAAGLCTGLAAIGGGVALASGIPAAIGATSEDPKNFGKSLIFVALGETLALYGVIISFIIISSIG